MTFGIGNELGAEETKISLAHETLRREVLNYILENDDDPIELLKQYAERIRVLINCDQVIYRDLEETRIMVNSPAIEQTWAVPMEYCLQCQHFDAHHPMYADGYTEMNNCQEGWKGIPVYKDCPIKSSLTRIIYCDGEVAGYLAIHYVQNYHEFTDTERTTLEEFARVLSISLSRYEVKKRAGEINELRRSINMFFSLSDQFDPIIVLDPETGEYDWLMSVAEDVINNTSMTMHGDDLYQNIGIDGASIIHEEDRAQFQAFYTRENMMKIAETGDVQETENRWFIQTENRYKWKYNKAVRMTDENGKVFVVVGVIDTTDEKEKEEELKKQKKIFEEQQALSENASRFFALEDNFESLYDVNIKSGRYDVFVKGDFYHDNVINKLTVPKDYFEELRENIDAVIYEEDKEDLYNALTREGIRKVLSQNDHYDHYYRLLIEDKPVWFKMRVVYKNAEKKNVIIGVFNASEEMAAREKEARQLRDTELRLRHEQLRSEVLNFMISNEDDPVELIKEFGERLLVLIGCDQVIYRDLAGTRIMVNSEGIKNDWSVPLEYCRQCEHYNAFSPLYEDGYTEMSDCREGWKGVPVYHECPVKSLLTRIIQCDGETVGYMAIHYIRDYHQFDDMERHTLEVFARILSISLAKYKTKKENKELKLIQEMQSKYKEALDEISEEKHRNDILHDIIHSGKWSFTVNADDEVISADYSQEVMRVVNNDFSTGVIYWMELIHPDDKDAVEAAFTATIKDHSGNTPYDVAFRMIDRNGEYHWFHSAGRIIRNEDGTGEFFGIHIDITSQIEEQLKQKNLLEDARVAADAANQSKTNFLFNMSHDIRTPMNAISGFTTMARKYLDDREKVNEYLEKIDIAGAQLLKLINQVLEMARIESGKMEFDEKPVNIHEEYTSLVTVLSEQAKTSGLKFSSTISNIEHNHVLADAARMSSVTMNIAGNAMKYTPEGGSIDFVFKEIPGRKKGYASYHFTVADTGIGMSREYLEKIYEPFSRENSSTVSKIQGTGLGMSIVKTTIDLMGGSIDVWSEPGKGTRFDIIVDFKIDDKAEKLERAGGKIAYAFEGRRVLLVEDNEMNREIAKDILEDQGFVIEDAEDGDIAVDMVQNAIDRKDYGYYDFILMDIQMPRMNGYEATTAIRAMEAPLGIHIPIIAMTANAFEEDRQNAFKAGMDEHLAKPVDVRKMLKVIADLL